jgi:GNAT superfamily N-acetyltransferase
MNNPVFNKEYRIERLNKDNLADVAKLYTAVYGKPAPFDFFLKKYDTAYTGKQYIGFIAYNNHQVAVGYYGVIPCFLQHKEDIILSAQSADTMTHPQYRYKGLFVELSNRTLDLCRSEGIRLIFGFPNQHSLHGAVHRVGWKVTEKMDCFIIPVRSVPFKKVVAKLAFLQSLYARYQQWILKKYLRPLQGISNSVIGDGYVGVYRDADYLTYKTYDQTRVIQIGESLVWIKLNSRFIIGDMQLAPDRFADVMRCLKQLAAKLGIHQIQFHTSMNTGLHAYFVKRFEPVPSFPVMFQDFGSGIRLDKIKFTFADIDIF